MFFFNCATRYENNTLKQGNKLFSLSSHESENKIRLDINKYIKGWKYNYGLDAQYVQYDANIFNIIRKDIKDSTGNSKIQVAFAA